MKQHLFLLLFMLTCYCTSAQQAGAQNRQHILTDKDSIAVLYHTRGCFNSEASKIVIHREADRYIARLYEVTYHSVNPKGKPAKDIYITGAMIGMRILTDQQLQDLARFRQELTISRTGMCTTNDKYIISTNYWSQEITDGSCSWNGYQHLKASFFEKN